MNIKIHFLPKWVSIVVFGYKKPLVGDADWKIYDPQKTDGKGALSKYINPPQELKEIALSAKNAIGKDIIGFDFIYTDEGYKIIDENGRPGLYPQCIADAKINITTEIIHLIQNKLKK